MAAVVNRQSRPESQSAFESFTISSGDLPELVKWVLEELSDGQKEVIQLASKGITRCEIAAMNKISLDSGKTRPLSLG